MAKKVLVVDDEKLIVKGLRFSLEQEGMEVDCAYDGEEALDKAKEKEYDIILLDVMLPKQDGFAVCQQIREFSSVPIIMLTARGEDMDKILGLEYGADDYITKCHQHSGSESPDQGDHAPDGSEAAEGRAQQQGAGDRRSEAGSGEPPGLHCGQRDQSHRQGIRCAGAAADPTPIRCTAGKIY